MVIYHSAQNFETQIALITQIDSGCENQCNRWNLCLHWFYILPYFLKWILIFAFSIKSFDMIYRIRSYPVNPVWNFHFLDGSSILCNILLFSIISRPHHIIGHSPGTIFQSLYRIFRKNISHPFLSSGYSCLSGRLYSKRHDFAIKYKYELQSYPML